MTVNELIQKLAALPSDMEVIGDFINYDYPLSIEVLEGRYYNKSNHEWEGSPEEGFEDSIKVCVIELK